MQNNFDVQQLLASMETELRSENRTKQAPLSIEKMLREEREARKKDEEIQAKRFRLNFAAAVAACVISALGIVVSVLLAR